ncbi:MAG: hypothetical protein GWO04_16025 [Actinobacteria bacterium]|nr:hypothetical protein [Actinomycetota bacterium]
MLAPFLPVTSKEVLETLGLSVGGRAPTWEQPGLVAGTTLGPAVPLFAKVEAEA